MPSYIDEDRTLIQETLLRWLKEIYKDNSDDVLSGLACRLSRRMAVTEPDVHEQSENWNQETCLLITYADSITDDNAQSPLASLGQFCEAYLDEMISTVHSSVLSLEWR